MRPIVTDALAAEKIRTEAIVPARQQPSCGRIQLGCRRDDLPSVVRLLQARLLLSPAERRLNVGSRAMNLHVLHETWHTSLTTRMPDSWTQSRTYARKNFTLASHRKSGQAQA